MHMHMHPAAVSRGQRQHEVRKRHALLVGQLLGLAIVQQAHAPAAPDQDVAGVPVGLRKHEVGGVDGKQNRSRLNCAAFKAALTFHGKGAIAPPPPKKQHQQTH